MACSTLYHRCIYVMWNKKNLEVPIFKLLKTEPPLCAIRYLQTLFMIRQWSSGSWHWQSGAWVNFWLSCSYKMNSISNFFCTKDTAWRKTKVFHKSLDCYHLNQTQTRILCVQPVLGSGPCCPQPDYTVSYLWKQRS